MPAPTPPADAMVHAQPAPQPTYLLKWTVVEKRRATLPVEEAADLLGVTVEELERTPGREISSADLADSLSEIEDDDTGEGLTREDITVDAPCQWGAPGFAPASSGDAERCHRTRHEFSVYCHHHITPSVLTAKLRDTIDLPDGPLILFTAGWSKETSQRHPDLLTAPDVNIAEWRAAMGPYEHATLSADGRGLTARWCQCKPEPMPETWVRYERYTTEGRAAHGYVCPTCRHITQTG